MAKAILLLGQSTVQRILYGRSQADAESLLKNFLPKNPFQRSSRDDDLKGFNRVEMDCRELPEIRCFREVKTGEVKLMVDGMLDSSSDSKTQMFHNIRRALQ